MCDIRMHEGSVLECKVCKWEIVHVRKIFYAHDKNLMA